MRIIGNLLIFALCLVVVGVFSLGFADSTQAQAQAITMPVIPLTVVVRSLADTPAPSATETNAPSATAQPVTVTPTNTPAPSSTQIAYTPSPTVDFQAAATGTALAQVAEENQIRIDEKRNAVQRESYVTTIAYLVALLVVTVVAAFTIALVGNWIVDTVKRTIATKPEKPTATPAQDTTTNHNEEIQRTAQSISEIVQKNGYKQSMVLDWVTVIDETLQGVLTAADEVHFYTGKNCPNPERAIFKSQVEYRSFERTMKALGFLDKVGGGGYSISVTCYKWLSGELK